MSSVSYFFPGGRRKALTLSYDDGVVFDRRLIDIFNRHGLKGTFHLNSGLMSAEGRIDAQEVAQVYAGHEVACHTVEHPFLERVCREEIIHQVLSDRRALERLVDYPVRGLSYPYGTCNSQVIETLRGLGIAYARTTAASGNFSLPDDFLQWHPTCHHGDDLLGRAEAFRSHPYALSLFYVWGHSYEFDRADNWDLMERFCELVAHDADIWYATNIEIFDYVSALRRLEYSVDRTRVRNPSALSVWVATGDGPVEIAPGELRKLAD